MSCAICVNHANVLIDVMDGMLLHNANNECILDSENSLCNRNDKTDSLMVMCIVKLMVLIVTMDIG